MDKSISDRIRLIRLSRGLSQENISNELGISVGAYSNIETGKTDLTISRLKAIARVLKAEVTSLIEPGGDSKLLREPHSGYQVRKLEDKIHQCENIIESQKNEIAYLKEIIALMKSGKKGSARKRPRARS